MLAVRSLTRMGIRSGVRSMATAAKEPIRVCVTGSGGLIGYALVPMIASGQMFGPDQPVAINLLDIPVGEQGLRGLAMELDDAAYPLLVDVVATTDQAKGFKDCDAALLVGATPRGPGMERKDLLAQNAGIFKAQGQAIAENAKANIKCLVVGNPANTNAMLLQKFGNLPPENVSALTRLDQNRAQTAIARKVGVHHNNVSNVIIWGNHSATQFPDAAHGTVTLADGSVTSIYKAVGDDAWIQGQFCKDVQTRGALVIKTRGKSSATSAASSVVDSMRDWWCGTEDGRWVSMGIWSNGNSYGIADGIFYSFPTTVKNGKVTVIDGLEISDFARGMMKATEQELLEEQATALAAVA
eukprot:TRINITY_DN67147_c1_g9_i1.p2 TRINITY_DN67147_c1_g9~~TRINITY_DN67147_c1_g9_i1.p2  ORF type:complete len:371 (-),score=78.24 TRINITY_DN67147_c1_g9_i1:1507-2571(-)